jgi:hypothetical protein
MKTRLTRRELETLPRRSLHQARNWSKADVSLIEWPPQSGQLVVVKDMRTRPLWFRVLAGRALMWREWRALRALEDLSGVPSPLTRPDADCFVMEYKPGRQLDSMEKWEISGDAVEKIVALLAEVHRRGVTHGDLHSHNILLDDNGEVALIDWATACVFGARRLGPKAVSFDEWKALDERALAKIKCASAPLDVTPRERDLLLHGGSRAYRLIKGFKGWKERVRGVDEETQRNRDRGRRRTERHLNKYGASLSEDERRQLREELEKRKSLKRETLLGQAGSGTGREPASERPTQS